MTYQIDLALSRRPVAAWQFVVKLDDLDYTPYFGFGWSTTHSSEQSFATATLPVLLPLTLSEGRHTITIYAGWNGVVEVVVFRGEIVARGATYVPAGGTLTCGGYLTRTNVKLDLKRAFYYDGGTPEETADLLDQIPDDFEAIPVSTDGDIIINIIEAYDLTPSTCNHSIEASAFIRAKLAPILWDATTQPGWSLIQELDQVSDYRTFDGRTGAVYRRRLYGTVPESVKHTFGPDDILNFPVDTTYDVVNQSVVLGAAIPSLTGDEDEEDVGQVRGVSPVGGPLPSPYIPTPPGVATDQEVNSPLIETDDDAQLLSDMRLGRKKQPLQQGTLTTFACTDFDVADAVGVISDELTSNMFIVTHTVTGNDPLPESVMVLRGSTVAEPRPNQPPLPAFTTSVLKDAMIDPDDGVLKDATLITVDMSGSSDADGQVVAWSLTVGGGTPITGTGQPGKVTVPTFAASPVAISVTVTDDGGLSATLTGSVTWGSSDRLIEPIALAETTQAAVSIDGDLTWTTRTPPAATMTAPIMLGNLAECQGAAFYRSPDQGVTYSLRHTFGAAVTAMWCNEVITTRWVTGLANGQVHLSTSDGDVWTLLYTFAAAVNDIAESPFAPGEMQACSGVSGWHTFSGTSWTAEVTTTGTMLRVVAGFGKRWYGDSLGVIRGVDTLTGTITTITLPVASPVTGLTLPGPTECLGILTASGATYTWTTDGGLVTDVTVGSAIRRAVKSGQFVGDYVFAAGTFGKRIFGVGFFDVRLMTGGRDCVAGGFLGTTRPVVVSGQLLIPTWGAAVGGLWVRGDDGTWALSNSGLPTGKYWYWIAANPFNPDQWAMIGGTSPDDTAARTASGGTIRDSAGDHIVWVTSSAGASWTAVPVDVPSGSSEWRHLNHVEWSETTDGVLLLSGRSTVGAQDRHTRWSGTVAGLTGTTVAVAALDVFAWCVGASGELVADSEYAFGYWSGTSWTTVGSGIPRSPMLEREGGTSTRLVITRGGTGGVGTLAATANYRATAPTTVGSGYAGDPVTIAQGVVYLGGDTQVRKITNAWTSPTSTLEGPILTGERLLFIRAARQARTTNTTIAARIYTTTGNSTRDCLVKVNGGAWQRVAGPSGAVETELSNRVEVLNR